MTCEQCQELISAFLDDELESKISNSIQTHLTVCAECAKVCEDFASLLDCCDDAWQIVEEDVLPPNPQALWCRINNVVESEAKTELAKDAAEKPPNAMPASSGWRISKGQIALGIFAIALVSSLFTFLATRGGYAPNRGDMIVVSDEQPSIVEKFLGKLGFVETPQQRREKRIKECQAAIDYWNQRAQTRRSQWNAQLREAFDRNLREIDQAVAEHRQMLQQNPQDDISGEMLDSSMNEKVELLREFAEL